MTNPQPTKIYVDAFIVNDLGKTLAVKRSDTDTFLPGQWELPGGGVESGEGAEDALRRESREECGLVVEIHEPLAILDYTVNQSQRLEIQFYCTTTKYDVTLSGEHSDYQWVKPNELKLVQLSS